jgi:hypothetical protein
MPGGCSLAWNTDFERPSGGRVVSSTPSVLGWNGLSGGGVVSCGALLGPEGAEAFLVAKEAPALPLGECRGLAAVRAMSSVKLPLWGCVRVWVWGRPFFENCTVDASIFVAKLVRAHGGCLGTRSR